MTRRGQKLGAPRVDAKGQPKVHKRNIDPISRIGLEHKKNKKGIEFRIKLRDPAAGPGAGATLPARRAFKGRSLRLEIWRWCRGSAPPQRAPTIRPTSERGSGQALAFARQGRDQQGGSKAGDCETAEAGGERGEELGSPLADGDELVGG